jgi:hypothetical protein
MWSFHEEMPGHSAASHRADIAMFDDTQRSNSWALMRRASFDRCAAASAAQRQRELSAQYGSQLFLDMAAWHRRTQRTLAL